MMWIATILPILSLTAVDGAGPLATSAPPPPIFWRQKLFSIPFQVSRTNNPAQQPAQVQLWVSPDRGKNWGSPDRGGKWAQRPWLTETPQKGYFLFQAGNDGEYWFDVRTVDRSGQIRPEGPNSPKLVVVVDTTPPAVELAAQRGADGRIVASFRIDEPYLKSDSLAIEYRFGPTSPWQAVAIAPGDIRGSDNIHSGEAKWQPPYAAGTMEVRLRVSDLAGNPAEGHAQVNLSAPASGNTAATTSSGTSPLNYPYPGSIPAGTGTYTAPGATSQTPSMSVPPGAAASSSSGTTAFGHWPPQNPSTARMPWPAENSLSGTTPPAPSATDNNDHTNTASGGAVAFRVPPPATNQLVTVRDPAASGNAAAASSPASPFSDFRTSSPSGTSPANPSNPFNGFAAAASAGPIGANGVGDVGPPPGEKLRWINSRVFQLTYDTRALGGTGNVPVQLWGTRDGGKTWQSYGVDPKGQSPMLVTVPEEGIYGFQMLLQTGDPRPASGYPGAAAGRPPLPGDVPRTWIGIDLTKPIGRITQARQGIGRDGDKLLIAWEASDNRALADKPITLSYSETAGGPWILIASELPNTAQYNWQLKSSLPQRVYLRLEVRDAAGNVGVFETPEPTALDLTSPMVPVRDLRPLGWNEFRPGQQTYLR